MPFKQAGKVVLAAIMLFGSFSEVCAAEDRDPKDLIGQMSDAIAGLDKFRVDGDAYTDWRLPAGLIVENASEITVRVRRPGAIRLTRRSTEDTLEIYFSEKNFTVFTESTGFYAQTEIEPGIDSALHYAIDEFGIDAPFLDFLVSDVAANLLADAEQVQYLGTDLIRGQIYSHVVIRQSEIDVQVWIANEGQPLPGKLSISSKWEGGAPRFVLFMSWDLAPDIPDGKLVFTPPEGATEIQILSDPVE